MSEESKNETKNESKTTEKKSNACFIISTINYPIYIEYNKEKIKLSPNQTIKIEEKGKLKPLPKGVLQKDIGG